ncbi:muscarinic acetylcholine receptor DM1 isoform X1 [Tribolium madens]|uniref:muscarinic acetylcholine receptor DM1 isoform X1 n=1 Tax=Tribolium madens TaxID=41895 RepID=UPI001CF7379B|nr:muscarinic acetylcholine receptor DM1 isoform X1 [Tribolium madens]XP_044259271.1 muscarinic acetylcholine receptor DM1 isoform X1 [Tribolium madens]
MNTSSTENTSVTYAPHEATYSITQVVFIGTIAGILSVVTVVGNIMVMISFKIDKQLQTISNYFLFSLAVADFAIGLISMPLFTVSTLLGYWPLGPLVCDTWLALDYLASNASVLNLLIISFDRYFSVTRPLTYRAKRTTNRAAIMIACAWGISLLLWPPWIYSWPYIEGERTVPENECYIQFIETNHYITFGTAIAAFYVPVTVMCFLYWRIWRETEKRQKDLPNLQAGKKDSSKRSNSSVFVCSDEANNACSTVDLEDWRRPRSESSTGADTDSVYMHSTVCVDHHRRKRPQKGGWLAGIWRIRAWCVAWWHSGREDSDTEEESPSEQGQGCITPVSLDTPLQSSVSRCTSLNVIRDPYVSTLSTQRELPHTQANMTPTRLAPRDSRSLPTGNRLAGRSVSSDSVYTILIRLPGDPGEGTGCSEAASIKMIPEDVRTRSHPEVDYSMNTLHANHLNRRPSAMPDIRIPLNAKIIPKQLAGKTLLANATKNQGKKKKKTQEKKADKKAAKTLSAILLTFIITWTPYNVLVLLKPVTASSARIPPQLWDFFYYLCYINSTINPVCYALCNASFRRTYLRILQCKWHNRNRAAMNRGFYN